MGQEKSGIEIVEEYLRGGGTLRELSRKYGVKRTTLHRLVKGYEKGARIEVRSGSGRAGVKGEMSTEVKTLQRELEEARLEAELYKTMIRIAEEELGIPIRKKYGAKR